MTKTPRSDGNSGQVAFGNSAFRHLFRNRFDFRSAGFVSQLPIRYRMSLCLKDLWHRGSAAGGEAPVKDTPVDSNRQPSQKSPKQADENPNNGQTYHVNRIPPNGRAA